MPISVLNPEIGSGKIRNQLREKFASKVVRFNNEKARPQQILESIEFAPLAKLFRGIDPLKNKVELSIAIMIHFI